MDWCPVHGLLMVCTQCDWDRLQNHLDPDQDKTDTLRMGCKRIGIALIEEMSFYCRFEMWGGLTSDSVDIQSKHLVLLLSDALLVCNFYYSLLIVNLNLV